MLLVDQAYLKELFEYNPDTGDLIVKKRTKKRCVGEPAGWLNDKGYLITSINRRKYRIHVLIWLYVYGEFPKSDIDHKDGNKTNNKLNNLRLLDHGRNIMNQKKPRADKKSSNSLGVWFDKRNKKYVGEIKYKGKRLLFRRFATEKEASLAVEAIRFATLEQVG